MSRVGRELQITLQAAYREAVSRRHAYLTVEHLLYALTFNERGAGVAEDLGAPLVEGECVEQVLDGHVGVATHRGLAQRRLQREVELPADLAHSFSTPARRG